MIGNGRENRLFNKKIAIIFHENDKGRAQYYSITRLAEIWQERGIDTVFVFGTKRFVPADLAILHVDLSVVPDRYIEFAQEYPIVLNGKVKDIRKSSFSDHIVHPGDDYEGKIIVKSDLNHAGKPERRMHPLLVPKMFQRLWRRAASSRLPGGSERLNFDSPKDYLILEHLRLVPEKWFERKDIVIEKFLPELDHGHYLTRSYYFLGDSNQCVLWRSTDPIVKRSSATSMELVDVHQEIAELRRKFHFDYGKFDYVIHENVPVLVDINKTVGAALKYESNLSGPYLKMRRAWASGIYSYFT
jgi:hypothetical protein